MSSRKHLKKEINDTLGRLIEEVYVKELSHQNSILKKSEKIIDEAISIFDDLIQKCTMPRRLQKNITADSHSLQKKHRPYLQN